MGSQAGRTRKGAALRTPQDAEGSAPDCGPESWALRVTLGLALILERTGLGWIHSEVPVAPVVRSLNEKRLKTSCVGLAGPRRAVSPECS